MASRPFHPSALMIALCGAVLAGCGGSGEGVSFEAVAEQVAAIPVEGAARAVGTQRPRTVTEAGLRPALNVEVLDVHDFWDARDGIAVAAPILRQVTEAVPADTARAVTAEAVNGLRGAQAVNDATDSAPVTTRLIQLGAYSSETAARAAWSAAAARAGGALDGLHPRLETVQVGGRTLTRLRVAAPETDAPALCRAAQVTDPFCSSTGAA
ncbi:SPOR domain-containing protein [Brevundimonas lutea]|uniref:SPOR domain-containing protein n=1 Tax=Brevundimonas lutea TaxID=2293980 RepID=UPI000F041730|nr:SPOR domain-containing protein [Brevundimonas lutea]